MKQANFLLKTAALLTGVFLLLTGCKKEDDLDPNIAYKTYNIAITNTTSASDPDQELAFDIDGDGSDDFKFDAEFQNIGGDTTITEIQLQSTIMDNKVLTEPYIFPGGQVVNKLKSLTSGYKINASSDFFHEFGFGVLSASAGTTLVGNFGFTDGADKLIGFSFLIGTETHYGWLRVNVSSDLKTMRIKEGAYHKIADVEIGAGDK